MTRQPAVQLSSHLPVAADAETHFEFYRSEPVHGLHVPVAVGAIQLGPQDMGLVTEEDEVGEDEDSDPGDRPFREKVFLLLENFRMVGNDVFVAEKTFFHGRKPGMLRAFHEGVAEAAVDLLYPGMDTVAEEDWLLLADASQGGKIVKIPHGRKEDCPNCQPDVAAFHLSKLGFVHHV